MTIPQGYSRRLVGPNLFFTDTGAVLDIPLQDNRQALIEIWYLEMARLLPGLKLEASKLRHMSYSNGIRLAMSAPPDILMAACDVIDFSWASACRYFETGMGLSIEQAIATLSPVIESEQSLVYRQLYDEAKKRGLNVFRKDKEAVIGSGTGLMLTALDRLNFDTLNWDEIYDIPAVIITGTNGKTTTVRLTHHICTIAGFKSGYASTDWVEIGDEIIDYGDYSGPTGHQFVLSHPEVEVAILESARGGLLKRGLIETFVSAAAVTNISADHLGEDGVDSLEHLYEAKRVVYRASAKKGASVINVDDPHLIAELTEVHNKRILVSQRFDINTLKGYMKKGDVAFCIEKTWLCYYDGHDSKSFVALNDIPITAAGHARHNIENALIASALAFVIGVSLEKIAEALQSFGLSEKDNLGRSNVFSLKTGGTVIVDFAHNPASMEAILHMAQHWRGDEGRSFLMMGTTGDRRNLIKPINEIIMRYDPDVLIVKEISRYLRGADPGQLPAEIISDITARGYDRQKIRQVDDELAGLLFVLERIGDGDVAVLCCHEDIEKIAHRLSVLCNQEKD
ncbi:MAG: Mur ligase family protein [Francisellaceae bacterium]